MNANRFLAAGFVSLGLLVGSIAGLSTSELTTTLLALLFAMVGGSVIAFIKGLDDDSRRAAGLALAAFSIAATVGVYAGLTVRLNDVLRRGPARAETAATTEYLRANEAPLIAFLQAQVTRGELPLVDACRQIPK